MNTMNTTVDTVDTKLLNDDRSAFQAAFDSLGYDWSESNQEKAFLGWQLYKRQMRRRAHLGRTGSYRVELKLDTTHMPVFDNLTATELEHTEKLKVTAFVMRSDVKKLIKNSGNVSIMFDVSSGIGTATTVIAEDRDGNSLLFDITDYGTW